MSYLFKPNENWHTWKSYPKTPTPEQITQLGTIENVIEQLFETPDYGTREPITDHELIKAILSLIRNYEVADESHYNNDYHKVYGKGVYIPTTLSFKGSVLCKNGKPMQCDLNDEQFKGMRINVYSNNRIDILLDFYDKIHGYAKKCIAFRVKLKRKLKFEKEKRKKEEEKVKARETATVKAFIKKQILLTAFLKT